MKIFVFFVVVAQTTNFICAEFVRVQKERWFWAGELIEMRWLGKSFMKHIPFFCIVIECSSEKEQHKEWEEKNKKTHTRIINFFGIGGCWGILSVEMLQFAVLSGVAMLNEWEIKKTSDFYKNPLC